MKVLAVVLLAGGLLFGCTAAPEAAEPVAVATTQAKPVQVTEAPVSKEEAFLTIMRKEYPQLKNTSDKVLIDAAHAVCDLYDDGKTFLDIVGMLLDSGMTAEQAGYTIGASSAAFCPNYNG